MKSPIYEALKKTVNSTSSSQYSADANTNNSNSLSEPEVKSKENAFELRQNTSPIQHLKNQYYKSSTQCFYRSFRDEKEFNYWVKHGRVLAKADEVSLSPTRPKVGYIASFLHSLKTTDKTFFSSGSNGPELASSFSFNPEKAIVGKFEVQSKYLYSGTMQPGEHDEVKLLSGTPVIFKERLTIKDIKEARKRYYKNLVDYGP